MPAETEPPLLTTLPLFPVEDTKEPPLLKPVEPVEVEPVEPVLRMLLNPVAVLPVLELLLLPELVLPITLPEGIP